MEPRRLSVPAAAIAVVSALAIGVIVGVTFAPSDDSGDQGDRPQGRQAPGLVQGRRVVDGVRVGYPRTSAGAAAAAVTYGNALGEPRVLFTKARLERVAGVVGTERYVKTIKGEYGRAVDAVKRGTPLGQGISRGDRGVYLTTPVTYRVANFSQDRATVTTWNVSVAGNDAGFAPRAGWASGTARLVWSDGDWKLDTARSSDGPTPAPTDDASDPADLLATLDEMKGWSYAP